MPSCEGAIVSGPRRRQRVLSAHPGALRAGLEIDVERARAGDLKDRAQLQMVLQVLADAGQLVHDRRRRSWRARPAGRCRKAPAYAACRSRRRSARSRRLRAPRRAPPASYSTPVDARAVQQQCAATCAPVTSRRLGRDSTGLRNALRRAPAPAAPLVDLEIIGALVVAAVEVGDLRDADLGRRVAHGVENGPGDARPLDPPFAAGAVQSAFAPP